ncbi:extracellular solute-binding protein [Paucilactobacillus vaccinostercus DSM 20634]|jgi:putative glutamine transport system substrate-binding protein|uniref:Extracellular solute-binding protein n=1 Tax=Paucilactobacillus vaccinostercus DSM 20634 TaxID=1423813 RepID=A0A0R2ABI0_9LACO|nr:transporter substrate-binding domain-containing protein [Paucilactobacillus vaccinostercus]KRM61563.1 extracellular solute-binding protein [Paucilactobacillus vaccinostercus DSM 20634]RRG10571.1 MAG: glutamine ABC transporter substrate-binding protein [Lactobacillus sp.]
MKKLTRFMGLFSALALLLILMTSCGSNSALSKRDVLQADKESNTITWGVKADTKLFGLMNVKTNQVEGFEIDLAKAMTKEILGKNGKAIFVPVTSQTRVPLLRNGNIDAIMATMTITPDRAKQVDFTRSYFNAGQAILVKKGSPIKSVKDLDKSGSVVLGVTGSNSVENIAKYAPKARVLQLSDYAQALTALKSGQGQALTTDNGILYGMSVENPGYTVVGGSFTKEPYGIAVNKGQDKFRHRLNKALTTLEKNGTYNRILKKWFGNVQGFNYEEMKR